MIIYIKSKRQKEKCIYDTQPHKTQTLVAGKSTHPTNQFDQHNLKLIINNIIYNIFKSIEGSREIVDTQSIRSKSFSSSGIVIVQVVQNGPRCC